MKLCLKFSTVVFIAALSVFSTNINASLITNIDTETISYNISTGGFGWSVSYDIGFVEQNLLIDVDVFLTGDDPGNNLRDIWEHGIESIWSSAFDVFDGTYYYDILFNVDWLSSITGSDYTVYVNNGDGAVNLEQWYTGNPSGWGYSRQGDIAAHEFGHMLGLFDEYNGGALDPITGLIRPNSIMGENLAAPQTDHFDAFLDWANLNYSSDPSFSLASGEPTLSLMLDQGNHFYEVSEPNMIMLFIILLISLNVRNKTRLHTFYATSNMKYSISN